MAFTINVEDAGKNDGGGDFKVEEKWIPEGDVCARMVGYIELGLHVPTFGIGPDGKPAPATYDTGKKQGQIKDPAFEMQTLWATGCEHTGDEPLYLLGGDYDRVKIADYQWKDPSKITNKTNMYKIIMKMRELTEAKEACSLADFIGQCVMFPVTNKPNAKSKIEGMQYANTKFMDARTTTIMFKGKVMGDEAEDLPKIGTEEGEFTEIQFHWDNPTAEAYKALKPWHRKRIRAALNFITSPVHALLDANPELYKLDARNEKKPVDAPADTPMAPPTDAEVDSSMAPPLQGAAAALLKQAQASTTPDETTK